MKTKSIKISKYAKNLHNYFVLERLKGKKYTQSAIRELLDVGHFYGTMTTQTAFFIARVSEKTFNRWLNGECEAPLATLELLRMHAYGQPPNCHNNEFKDWRFVDGKLISNDYVYDFSAMDLKAVPAWQPLANKWFFEIKRLENTIAYNEKRYQFKVWALEAEIKRLIQEATRAAHQNRPTLRLVY